MAVVSSSTAAGDGTGVVGSLVIGRSEERRVG